VKAKEMADQYKLDYVEKNIDTAQNLNELLLKVPDVKTIPQIFWNDRYIGGYTEFANEIENTIGGYGEGQC
jgi:glutaredoxin